jgi:hypothetical protein
MSFESRMGRHIEAGPELGPDSPEQEPQACLVEAMNSVVDKSYKGSGDYPELQSFVVEGDLTIRAKLACFCGGQCFVHRGGGKMFGIQTEYLTFEGDHASDISCARGNDIDEDYLGAIGA